jgi:hypothetical protein
MKEEIMEELKKCKKYKFIIEQLPKKLASIDIDEVKHILCSCPSFDYFVNEMRIEEKLEKVGLSKIEAWKIVHNIAKLLSKNRKLVSKYPINTILDEKAIREVIFRVIIEELERELEEKR